MSPDLSSRAKALMIGAFLLAPASLIAKVPLLDGDTFEEAVVPFLEKHCYSCHGPEKQKGSFRLDDLEADFLNPSSAGHWVEVMDNINLGDMPPEDEPIPDIDELSLVTNWIAREIRHAKAASVSTDGRVLIRRLNRMEYTNTVEDLFQLSFLPNEGPMDILPPDGTLDGFDKVSRALLLDPSLLDTWLDVAAHVVDKAIHLSEPPVPTKRSRMEYELTDGGIGYIKDDISTTLTEDGIISQASGMRSDADLFHPWNGTLIPVRGRYTVRIRMGADPGDSGEPVYVKLKRSGDGDLLFTRVEASIEEPEIYEITRAFEPAGGGEIGVELLTKGDFSRVNYHHSALNKAASELSTNGNLAAAGRARAQMWAEGHFQSRPHPESLTTDHMPEVFFDWIEIEGPLYDQWPPTSTQIVFPKGAGPEVQNLDYVREIFTDLMPKAFRRPVARDEVERYVSLVQREWEAEDDFVTGVKTGLMAVLSSPSFLYLFEPGSDEDSGSRELDAWELASRLSYFLWSSLPDEELRDLAAAGKLANDETLLAQMDRMLVDPRAEALVEGFAAQWLKAGEFDRFSPDRNLYREFYSTANTGVNQDMNAEPLEFFRHILENDMSALSFLDSDWLMLNERLASYYGVPGVDGEEFRPVSLPAESPRGGLIGMGAFHKWGSDGNRTKPVDRGKYLLEVLFNDPPNPPPPNAGEVEPNVDGEKLTVRQRLDQHRTIESCATCHRMIDPWGFGVENFNVVGQWRTKQDGERSWWPDEAVIDSSGKLPNGVEFSNLEEFRAAVRAQDERFLRGLSEKMLIYALGRNVDAGDRPLIDDLVLRLRENGETFRSLIQGVVLSEEFQTK